MKYSYREREELEGYLLEREWTFATKETFSDFLREHELVLSVNHQVGDTVEKQPLPPGAMTFDEYRKQTGKDAGAELKAEIDRMRREAGVEVPVEKVAPRPTILDEVRDAHIDAVMKEEYLKTPEDLKRIRDVIDDSVTFVLDDFTEADALLILRPFGKGEQESTFAVYDTGKVRSEKNQWKDFVRICSVEEAATRTGWTQQLTVRFDQVINPAYLSQGSTAEEKELERSDGGSEPVL